MGPVVYSLLKDPIGDKCDRFQDVDSAQEEAFGDKRTKSYALTILKYLPWILFLLTAFTLAAVLSRDSDCRWETDSYENGFETDAGVIPTFKLKQIRFHGTPRFHENGTAYTPSLPEDAQWPEDTRYFDEPSDAVDNSWADLVGNASISISEDEARRAWGEKYYEYRDLTRGGYSAVPDVLHTIHCIDAIRREMHPEYYHQIALHGPVHLEHCLDYLRQTILCYSSTTLIPMGFVNGLHLPYINADQTHTCRDFKALKGWLEKRDPGGSLYVPRQKW